MTHHSTLLDRRLDGQLVRFVCATVLVVSVALLMVTLATTTQGRTVFGPSLGADYAAFYTGATILNEHPAEQLYDLGLQDKIYHELFPHVPTGQILPYANPPFVAALFRPLARLPYAWSFGVWLCLSAGFYGAGFAVLCKSLQHLPASQRTTALLLALSFEPFIMECWLGGQLSAVGLFFLALALACEQKGRPFGVGLALAGCLYKPTLLPLLLPMLLIARRWRTLAGFAVGGLALAGCALLAGGVGGCRSYLQLMFGYANAATGSTAVFRMWKFVDLNSFLKLLLGGHPSVAALIVLAVGLAALPFLVRLWWHLDAVPQTRRQATWAVTITATLVLNIYVGIYDTVLAVLAVLLLADALVTSRRDAVPALPVSFRWLMVLLYITPWLSQALARSVGFQPYTLVLAALVGYGWLLAGRRTLPHTDFAERCESWPGLPFPAPAVRSVALPGGRGT